MTRHAICAALLLALSLGGCGEEDSEAPSDHTAVLGGVHHKPGYEQPQVNCTGCHGSSLQGGEGPSCTSCHGVRW